MALKVEDAYHRLLATKELEQVGFERRQVFDIDISKIMAEYRAQILEDENGNLPEFMM